MAHVLAAAQALESRPNVSAAPASDDVIHELHASIHVGHTFFHDYLLQILLFIAVLIALSTFFCFVVFGCNRCLRRSMVVEHWRVFIVYLLSFAAGVLVLIGSFQVFNINVLGYLAGLGLFAIVVSFGLQQTISNAAAGVIMHTENIVEINADISVGGYRGTVVGYNLRHVHLRLTNDKGEPMSPMRYAFVPNGMFDGTVVVRHSPRSTIRRSTPMPQDTLLETGLRQRIPVGRHDSQHESIFKHT